MSVTTLPSPRRPKFKIGSRRKCDNCEKFYTVRAVQHRFHSDECRFEFNRFGTPLVRLKEHVLPELQDHIDEIEARMLSVLHPRAQARYKEKFPERATRIANIPLDDVKQAS